MPGFTPISMFPMLWEAEGVPFQAVVEELVTLARARHARRRLLRTHRASLTAVSGPAGAGAGRRGVVPPPGPAHRGGPAARSRR